MDGAPVFFVRARVLDQERPARRIRPMTIATITMRMTTVANMGLPFPRNAPAQRQIAA